jgi:hypothetical protein
MFGGFGTTDHPVHRDSMGTERTGVRESRPGQDTVRQSLVAAEVCLFGMVFLVLQSSNSHCVVRNLWSVLLPLFTTLPERD